GGGKCLEECCNLLSCTRVVDDRNRFSIAFCAPGSQLCGSISRGLRMTNVFGLKWEWVYARVPSANSVPQGRLTARFRTPAGFQSGLTIRLPSAAALRRSLGGNFPHLLSNAGAVHHCLLDHVDNVAESP